MNTVSFELDEIQQVAKQVLEWIDDSKFIVFDAEMGAGKTTLIHALLTEMGVDDFQGSPTYSLVNTYHSAKYGEVLHFDLYRLSGEEEAIEAGVEEMIYSGALCLVEWADRISALFPEEYAHLSIEVEQTGKRKLSYRKLGI
jgi:tRNA threonylcarbamoyladenosine biosynthesis protein TsaE